MRQRWARAASAVMAAMAAAIPAIAAPQGAPAPEAARGARVDTSKVNPDVEGRLAQFAPTKVEADLGTLSPNERKVLDKLIDASRIIGEIFLRQAWADNITVRTGLAAGQEPHRRAARLYFEVMAGAWDRIDSAPFVGDLPRPDGAGLYPPDMTKKEFEDWIAAHPAEAAAFKGLFTVIRRTRTGLAAVPYSQNYASLLKPAAEALKEAAALTDNASLRSFLEKRAAAFLNDDYYDSDVAWMDLDSKIEITIGPYETYEDRLYGYKAAFESFVTVKDADASSRLVRYKSELPGMERNLPIPDEYKNTGRGAESPIGVVDVAYTAGDARAGVQTTAYNLPNDERVREAKGSKKILLRNVMNAKFRRILQPIAERLIAAGQLKEVTADAFFNETLFHELSHGLGPGNIKVNGRSTEVRLELKDLYSSLEEAKADVMGAWNVAYMVDKGAFPESMRREMDTTFLAGMFRAVRFGIEEAHGQGVALQYNFLKERGAFRQDPATGRFTVDHGKFGPALRDLVREICLVQARGDYGGAKRLLDTYAKVPPELKGALDRLSGIPVDIRPIYPAAGETD